MSFALKSVAPAARALALPRLSSPSASSSFRSLHLSPVSLTFRKFKTKKKDDKKKGDKKKDDKATQSKTQAVVLEADPNARSLAEAFNVLRAFSVSRYYTKFIAEVRVTPDKAKPTMRGRTTLPKDPSTKPTVIYVFCKGADVQAALAAGAAQAGGEDLVDKLQRGVLPMPSIALATPDMAAQLQQDRAVSRLLGENGVLPQKKRGTVVTDVVEGVKDLKGVIDWRIDDNHKMTAVVGRVNFSAAEFEANLLRLLSDIRLCGRSAATAYEEATNYTNIERVLLSVTNGPSIPLKDAVQRVKELEQQKA